MDPAVAALDLTKAAAIIANMIESYLAGAPRCPTGKEPIMMNSKMADHHLARQACIYIRQSTPGQVRFNQESKERQYNLANQAKALGWMPEQIRILDGDLGHSGEQATHRDDI